MRETKKVSMIADKTVAIQCDRCGKKYWLYSDTFEAQEFVSFHGRGGYGSIIGEDTEFSVDLCQHCFVELCGPYIQYHDLEENPDSNQDLPAHFVENQTGSNAQSDPP